jgi:hypothetical protein
VFGGRAERHAGGVELLNKSHHVGQAAGEPVDPVDQQHVVAAGIGGVERRLQSGAVGGGAGASSLKVVARVQLGWESM